MSLSNFALYGFCSLQVTLLEGRDKCEIKLKKPMKFQYGRKDCIPTNPIRPYETTKEEVVRICQISNSEKDRSILYCLKC